ncbi:DUF2332 domain-containing protein [Pseudogracilibacillus sp. SE30717A]|uniref:DUF2332 domain-containing protein n=1 Tax=Pseudogracilibacillus sp. SE30717A TaxID=3098293 RepID=UPI00300DCF6F
MNKILSDRFIRFAKEECKGSSPLYEYLSLQIAEDDSLLSLSSHAQEGQPIPNLLFGAVHYLLFKGKGKRLGDYYPSITDNPKKDMPGAFRAFRELCLTNDECIKEILQTKLVQTNEVRRCAYLYPAFCYIYEKINQPLALIEIGTSAGLQLFWDRYCYSYGNGKKYGNLQSTVHITSKSKGNPIFQENIPIVKSRIGLDLHISNLNDSEDYLWLQALIWPEHHERRDLFRRAANFVKENSPRLIEGDGIELLPNILKSISTESVICIFHTHVANQIPTKKKHDLLNYIRQIGLTRNVVHLYNNMFDAELHLDYFLGGKEYNKLIGKTDGHGKWFEWKLNE